MKTILAPLLSLSLILSPMAAHAQASGGANIAKMALGMANGIIGSTILAKCKIGSSQPSVLIYAGGGLIYVASELLIGNAKKSSVEDISSSVDAFTADSKGGGDVQLKMMSAQIDDEKENLKFIKKRKLFMDVLKVVYTGATVMAVIETIKSLTPPDYKPAAAMCTPNGITSKLVVQAISIAYSTANSVAGQQDKSGKSIMMGLAGGAIMALLFPVTVATETVSMPLISSGYGRIAFFGGATALSFFVAADLGKQAKRSESQISDLEKSKKEFEKATKDLNGITEGEVDNSIDTPEEIKIKNGTIKTLAGSGSIQKLCVSNKGGSFEYSATACKSPVKFTSPNLDSRFYAPELQRFTNSTGGLVNSLATGDMAKAEIEMGSLQSQAANLEKMRDNLIVELNKKLKASGEAPLKFDSNAEMEKQIAAVSNELKKNGINNFGQDGQGLANSDTKEEKTNAEPTATSSNVADVPVVQATPLDDGINLGGNEESAEFENTGSVATLADRLNEFETSASDVVTDPGVSIFKQVSNRYLLNYEKVFSRKEIPVVKPAEND